jgi:hypothetical protein
LDISSSQPSLIITTISCPTIAYGQTVIIQSVPFSGTVASIAPDGQGMTLLMLSKTG